MTRCFQSKDRLLSRFVLGERVTFQLWGHLAENKHSCHSFITSANCSLAHRGSERVFLQPAFKSGMWHSTLVLTSSALLTARFVLGELCRSRKSVEAALDEAEAPSVHSCSGCAGSLPRGGKGGQGRRVGMRGSSQGARLLAAGATGKRHWRRRDPASSRSALWGLKALPCGTDGLELRQGAGHTVPGSWTSGCF